MRKLLVALGIAGWLVAVTMTAAAQATPSVQVDPAVGAPGDTVVTSGSGFGPGTVELFLDVVAADEALASVAVERDGTFEVRFAVPTAKAGDHRLIACRDRLRTGECRETAVAPFRILEPVTTTTSSTSTVPPVRSTTTSAPPRPTTTTSAPPRVTTTAPTLPPTFTTVPARPTTTSSSTTTPPVVATLPPEDPPFAVATSTTLGAAGELAADIPIGPDPTFDPSPDQLVTQTTPFVADQFVGGEVGDVDIELTHIEVTQGLQNLANEFPLVADRPTAVRLFGLANGESQSLASAFLEVSRDGVVLDVLEAENNPVLFGDTLIRASNDAAPYFLLDNSYLDGTLTVRGLAIAGDPTLSNDLDPSNNLIQTTVTFHEAQTVVVHAFPLYLGEDGTSSGTPLALHTAADGWLEQAMALYRLWPMGRFVFDPNNPPVGDAGSGWDMSVEEGGSEPFAALAAVHAANGYGPKELTMGMVSPDADVYWGGFAQVPGPVSWSTMRSGYSGNYPWHQKAGHIIAQELGHNTGLEHAPCEWIPGEPEPGELHGGSVDPLFPQSYSWPNCSIAPTDIEGFYGFDVMYKITGTDEPSIMSNNPSVSAPLNAAPFMSYKGIGKWLEPWHGCALLLWMGVPCTQTDLIPIDDDTPGQGQGLPPIGHAVPVWTCDSWNGPGEEGDLCDFAFDQPFDPTAMEDVDEELLVVASIEPDAGVADLTAGVVLPLSSKFAPSTSGEGERPPWMLSDFEGPDHLLLVRDGAGEVIGVQTLDVHSANGHLEGTDDTNPLLDGDDRGGPATLVVRIPALRGAASFEIVTEDGVLARLQPGEASPEVGRPVVELDGAVARLSWTASDPDGDQLATLVQYRAGGDWLTVGQPSGVSIDVPVDTLPGGRAGEFRLLVSDGIHQTTAVSDPVLLADRAPVAMILSPADGTVRPAGRSLDLRGSGIDAEDRDAVTYSWSSDLDGPLGEGEMLSVDSLREGRHTITLAVSDAAGNIGAHSISVDIGPSDLSPHEVREIVQRIFTEGPPPPPDRGGTPWTAIAAAVAVLGTAIAATWAVTRRRTAAVPASG